MDSVSMIKMARAISITVQCYSGYKGDETPRSFILGEKTVAIEGILDRWYEPEASYFRVRAGDGAIYIIRHNEGIDSWELTFFNGTPAR